MRRWIGLLLFFALIGAPACGTGYRPPPTLSPKAQVEWQGTRIIHAIDAVRDLAQDGTKTTPPVISEATATKVTVWHRAAIITIHDAPAGWAHTVDTGLSQLIASLPPTEKQQLAVYLTLAQTVLKDVLR